MHPFKFLSDRGLIQVANLIMWQISQVRPCAVTLPLKESGDAALSSYMGRHPIYYWQQLSGMQFYLLLAAALWDAVPYACFAECDSIYYWQRFHHVLLAAAIWDVVPYIIGSSFAEYGSIYYWQRLYHLLLAAAIWDTVPYTIGSSFVNTCN